MNTRRPALAALVLFLALSASSQAEWLNRFATPGDVTRNRGFFNLVRGFPSECPIIAVENKSSFPVVLRTMRFINGRYIGAGDPNLDDWYITVRKTVGDVLGMTEWNNSNAQVFPVGPPSQWSNYVGALDPAGRPVQDTILRGLERFRIVIPPRSVRYLGIANFAPVDNGFTFTVMTDWRLQEDDYGFMSTGEPPVKTISAITNGGFTNMAVNVEVTRLLMFPGDPR